MPPRTRALPLALLMVATTVTAAPLLQETEVWARRERDYASHFVYGIGVTWDDTILIACEARVGGADAAEKDLLIKRSTDHGATWSNDQVIEGANDHQSWSNPTFVTDGVTTYLFYTLTVSADIGRVFYRTTVDNGHTWSAPVELTSLWADAPHGWTQQSSIGHGIRKLKEPGRGRVLVAFHHRGAVAQPPAKRGYGNDVIALGPDGWRVLGGPALAPGRGTNEARLAERVDGSLMLLARQASGDNQLRARSDSRDGGETWSPWVTESALRGTVCDGGLLRVSDTCLLYSYPASTHRSAQQRQDLTIKASRDGGKTWNEGRLLHRGQATYSDLARDSVGNVYCIYGCDGTDFMGDRVVVARFNAEWATGQPAATVVVDDGDPGFSATGAWQTDPGAVGRYGATSRIAQADASTSATWKPTLPTAGEYEVYVRWPAEKTAGPATVIVSSGSRTLSTQPVDQRRDAASWYYVGTFACPAGDAVEVRLTGDGELLVDAVMFQQQ